jgi:cytochrome P450
VRVGPNHLTYTDVRAWKDIYGHRAGEHLHFKENDKSNLFYREQVIDRPKGEEPVSLIDASREEHSRLRRALAGGFSEKAMREQEAVIVGYVDMLVAGLKGRMAKGEKVDMVKWYNWFTFDVVGDLVFAESFGCLEGEHGHPFVDMVTGFVVQQAAFVALKYSGLSRWWVVKRPVNWAVKSFMGDSLKTMHGIMWAKLKRRLEIKEERTDLFDGLMTNREKLVSWAWSLGIP